MNKFSGLTISALAWLVLASAAEAITPDLRRAADRYDQAQVSGDRKLLESLLAGDYVLVNSSGATESKPEFIRDLTDPSYHLTPYTVRKAVERQWENGAVLGGVARLVGTDHQHAFDVCLRFADVWARRAGRWQVIFTEAARGSPQDCR